MGQIFWEDIEEGSEIPPLPKIATTLMLVKWAGASGDFSPVHYDEAFAAAQGVGRPIVHGQLKQAWLVQLVTEWIGENGSLRKLSCQFRGMDYPRPMKSLTEPEEGETLLCKGRVVSKYVKGEEHLVDCEVWVENGKGEKTTPGKATVVLPARES